MRNRFIALSLALIAALLLVSTGAPHTSQALAATMQSTLPAINKQIKIAVITPSAKNDLAWSESMYSALVKVQTEVGGKDKLDFTISENLFSVPDAAAAIRDYANQGFDIVIAHGTVIGIVPRHTDAFRTVPDQIQLLRRLYRKQLEHDCVY